MAFAPYASALMAAWSATLPKWRWAKWPTSAENFFVASAARETRSAAKTAGCASTISGLLSNVARVCSPQPLPCERALPHRRHQRRCCFHRRRRASEVVMVMAMINGQAPYGRQVRQ